MSWAELVVAAFLLATALLAAGHALLQKSDSRAALGWIAFCLLFPGVGALAYFLFGINRIQTQARRLRRGSEQPPTAVEEGPAAGEERVAPELQQLARISSAISRQPLVEGHRVTPLHNGEEAYPAMLASIESARRTVFLATYIFESNASGQRFIDALARAHERGVRVRVLIDGYGDLYHWPWASRQLRRRGVPMVRFLPPQLRPQIWHFNLRNHRKILTVDGRVAYTGGMNLGDRHLVGDGDARQREFARDFSRDFTKRVVDLHFRLVGPVVMQIEEVFREDWLFAAGESLDASPAPDESEERSGSDPRALCRVIVEGPNEDLARLRMVLVGALSVARHRVRIMTPYFLPSRELIAALEAAALRGVRVTVILPARGNLPYVHWATRHMLWELLERGVEIVYQPPPFVHTKLFLIDDQYALIGSFNLDPRSLRLNFELAVEVYDEELARSLADHADRVLERSRPVSLEEVDGRVLPVKIRDGLAWLFSPYM